MEWHVIREATPLISARNTSSAVRSSYGVMRDALKHIIVLGRSQSCDHDRDAAAVRTRLWNRLNPSSQEMRGRFASRGALYGGAPDSNAFSNSSKRDSTDLKDHHLNLRQVGRSANLDHRGKLKLGSQLAVSYDNIREQKKSTEFWLVPNGASATSGIYFLLIEDSQSR